MYNKYNYSILIINISLTSSAFYFLYYPVACFCNWIKQIIKVIATFYLTVPSQFFAFYFSELLNINFITRNKSELISCNSDFFLI